MSEVAAVAITVAKPGHEIQVRQALESLVPPTHKEAGMLQYDMHQDPREPRWFVCIERWETEATFAAHVNSPHVAAYLAKTADWIEHNEVRVLSKLK